MKRVALIVAAGSALAAATANLPLRTDSLWIDSVTGSMKGQTFWLIFGTRPRVHQSALHQWVATHQGPYTPQWCFLSESYKTVFGRTVGRGCALAPEIYPLHMDKLNTRFVETASDSEIAEFVRIMRTGTAEEKRVAVDAACDKGIGHRGDRGAD